MSCKSFRKIWDRIDNAPMQENTDTSDVNDSNFDVDALSCKKSQEDIWKVLRSTGNSWPKKGDMYTYPISVKELDKTLQIWEEKGIDAAMEYFYSLER